MQHQINCVSNLLLFQCPRTLHAANGAAKTVKDKPNQYQLRYNCQNKSLCSSSPNQCQNKMSKTKNNATEPIARLVVMNVFLMALA